MSDKVFSGKDGQLLIGSSSVVKVIDWNFEGQNETLETTTLNDTSRTYVYGLSGYSGSATLLYYKDGTGSFNVKKFLDSAISASTPLTVIFRLADTTDREITMNVLITSYSTGVSVGEVVRVQFSFTATGKPTFTLAPA